MTTTTAVTAWPTTAQLTRAAARVVDAFNAIEGLRVPYADDVELPGGPVPTLEEFAAISWFIEVVQSDIENMGHYLEKMIEARKVAASCMEPGLGGRDA